MFFSGNSLSIFTDFLTNSKQRVILNGQHASWGDTRASVPQGSILVHLVFLFYIKDLAENLDSNLKLFSDDTSLVSIFNNLAKLNSQLN